MDSNRFDRLTRALSTPIERRTGVRGLLGAAVAALGAVGLPTAAGARPGRFRAQGPCGNGGARANRCRRHRQCCTKYCDKRVNRCRCRHRGQTCTSQANCCNPKLDCRRRGKVHRCLPRATPPPPPPVDCEATLTGAGCEFLTGPGVWNCGNQNLTGVNLSGCDLPGASFFNANATNVNFTNTNLTNANFFDGNVTGAEWQNTTCPTGTNSDTNGDTCCGAFIAGQVPAGCPV